MANGNGRPVEVSSGIFEPNWMRSAAGGPVLLYLKLLHETPIGMNRWRGGRRIGTRKLALECGVPRASVRRWLDALEGLGWVKISRQAKGMVILIRKRKWWRGSQLCEVPDEGAENGPPPRAENGPPGPKMALSSGPNLAPNRAESGPQQGRKRPYTDPGEQTPQQLTDFSLSNPSVISPENSRTAGAVPLFGVDHKLQKARELATEYDPETRGLIVDAMNRCKAARKAGDMAPSIKLWVMQQLDRHTPDDVHAGTAAFLERDGIAGTPEKYWLGCVRGAKKRRERDEENEGIS